MDEGAPIEIANDDPLWNQAIQDVNAWRGACLQHFSAAEAAVTETLLLLSRPFRVKGRQYGCGI